MKRCMRLLTLLVQCGIFVAALYGGYAFYQNHLAGTPASEYPSHFEAGIMKIGPGVHVSIKQTWRLFGLLDRCRQGRWKLYEFSGSPEPEHFAAIWSASGEPLVAFELEGLSIERVKGKPPAEFRQRPDDTLLAARYVSTGNRP